MIAASWICTRHLRALLQGYADVPAEQDCALSAIQLDSRKLKGGELFVALPGSRMDGVEFIGQAVQAGAAAVIYATPLTDDAVLAAAQREGVPLLRIASLRDQLGEIAARFYGHPSRSMTVVGVTGTDGKTSVSHFIAQAMRALGKPCAVIGTIGNGLPGQEQSASHTTPDAIALQQLFAELRAQSVDSVSMEVSSHGLDQGRVNGTGMDIAVLTNLARDHMDYHKSLAAYAEAKRKLFQLPGLRAAVLNCDDDFGCLLADELELPVYGYGFTDDMPPTLQMRVKGSQLRLHASGLQFTVASGGQQFIVRSPLLGRFNASNLLAVVATLIVLGVPLPEAVELVHQLQAVPGRMQLHQCAGKPAVVVDYAHTPQALAAVLRSLREHLAERGGELWCVFGCGGDRDKGKRALMGAVAERYADSLVVTSDNPRTEQPEAIAEDILDGISDRSKVVLELDRARAIRRALSSAGADAVVLVAGKGHEDYQIIGEQRLAFSDNQQVQQMLEEAL